MRFGLFTTFYPPFNFGGDGIDVQRTARALVTRGHQVTVVHDVDAYRWLSGRSFPPQPVMQDGVEVLGLQSRLGVVAPLLTHQSGHPLIHGRTIAAIVDQRGFDVIVFNNVSLIGGPGLLAFGGDALKVYMAHEHWLVCPTHVLWRFNREACDERHCTRCVLSYRRPPQIWRYTGALERHLPEVDLFIARSEFSRAKHREFGFTPEMAVLPYFLPGQYPAHPPARTAPRPHARPYFVFVGRLTKIKGLDLVIPAFRRYPHADLLIIGDGEEADALRRQAQGMSNVHFLGRIPNDQLEPYYVHAIAALVPSAGFETFGIVLIESFRYGTPVLARRIGPFPEIIEAARGGLLFSDEAELIDGMTRLQDTPGYRDELADHAFRSAHDRWSEGVVIDRFLGLIDQAIARRATGSSQTAPDRTSV